MPGPSDWIVYILRCKDDSLYTGITIDMERRLLEHNGDNRLGSRYTRARRPVTLVYQEQVASRSLAAKREAQIKQLSKADKELLIASVDE